MTPDERHVLEELDRTTVFSPCRKWRYTLWRRWDYEYGEGTRGEVQPPYAQFIGLNPSTADETKDDPTIRRCIAFAKSWGYGALCMTNLFAWRDTLPKNMKKALDPIGPDNDQWLLKVAHQAGVVVAAWGKDGSHLYRAVKVKRLMAENGITLHCLRTNGDGSPEHPLYLPKDLKPVELDLARGDVERFRREQVKE